MRTFRDKQHPVQDGGEITVTASIGLAIMDEGRTFTSAVEMLGAADKAVYAAKDQGRNCSVIFSSVLDECDKLLHAKIECSLIDRLFNGRAQ